MKYIAFVIPDFNVQGYDWLYDMMENKSNNKFYVINAPTPEQAKKMLFDEIYKEDDEPEVMAYFQLKELEDSEEEILQEYGENDGNIILEIIDELVGLSEEERNDLPFYDSRVDKLSAENIKKLVYRQMQYNLGVAEITKELG